MNFMKLFLNSFMMTALLILIGCGEAHTGRPDLGMVQGTVTLDGTPVEGALVTFIPQDGRPSYGVSDADGHYELIYIREIRGAALGLHQVQITTVDRSDRGVPFKELFPAKYHSKTELNADVKPGKNTINFDLESR